MFQKIKSWNKRNAPLEKKKYCKRSPDFKPFLYFIALKRTISGDILTVSEIGDSFGTVKTLDNK